jgi:hypothetical protein
MVWLWWQRQYHDGTSDGADNDFDSYSKTNWLVWLRLCDFVFNKVRVNAIALVVSVIKIGFIWLAKPNNWWQGTESDHVLKLIKFTTLNKKQHDGWIGEHSMIQNCN